MMPTMQTPGPAESSSNKTLKIVGIVVLAAIALCGLAGTCLLVITLVFPTLGQ